MNADKFVVRGQTYDVLSPATFGDYIETVGAACINPLGYDENKLFLAYDDNVQKLFRATAAIAYSELLIKDTNCEPTTMAEALANALSAGGVSYDNTDSGLTASNVQDAIDEVKSELSHENLLDNPFFTVNRSNFASATDSVKTVDRWMWQKVTTGASCTYDANGHLNIVSINNDGLYQNLRRALEPNTTYTASIIVGGEIKTATFTTDANAEYLTTPAYYGSETYGCVINNGGKRAYMFIKYDNVSSTYNITAFKLERGSVSTLAMDVPPDQALETAKCATANPLLDPNLMEIQPRISTGVPNKNLFDNSWFTVNQKNFTSVNGTGGWIFDRWYKNPTGKVTLDTSVGVTLENGALIRQSIEPEIINSIGATTPITFSIMYSDGTLEAITVNKTSAAVLFPSGKVRFSWYTSSDTQSKWAVFTHMASSAITLRAIKMEIGSDSTLDCDVCPVYNDELIRCQRYFIRLKPTTSGTTWLCQGIGEGTQTFQGILTLPTQMRTSPTSSYSGNIRCYTQGGTNGTVMELLDSFYAGGMIGNHLHFTAETASSSINKGAGVAVFFNGIEGEVSLDANYA